MRYAELLSQYISTSGLSLREIAKRMGSEMNVKVDSSYISKLQNGQVNPPSEEISTALAGVTGGDSTSLILAGYMDRAPKEVRELLGKIVDYDYFYKTLLDYIEFNVVVEGDEEETLRYKNARDVINSPEFFRKLDPEIRQILIQGTLESLLEHDPDKYRKLMEQIQKHALSDSSSTDREGTLIRENPSQIYGVGKRVSIPIIGIVRAGFNGLAYEEFLGNEAVDEEDVQSGQHYWLKVKGDSMTGDGIFEGDLALFRVQPQVENGELAVVIIDGEIGCLKRIYFKDGGVVLHSSNPAYPPRIFVGKDAEQVRIVGRVKEVKRKF